VEGHAVVEHLLERPATARHLAEDGQVNVDRRDRATAKGRRQRRLTAVSTPGRPAPSCLRRGVGGRAGSAPPARPGRGPHPRRQGSRPAELPAEDGTENSAWLETLLAAADLVCWAKLICFAHVPWLARCDIASFRYRVLHVAAQLTRSARQVSLRVDRTWRWAAQIAEGFHRLRAAFT
jgi:hypothetical protein